MNMILFWTAMAIVFGLIEAVTAGLVSLWFIAGSVIGAIAAALGWHWGVQTALFLIVSVLVLVFLRPMLSKHINPKKEPTNADALIGKTAVVILPIDNLQGVGQVKVSGSVWSAQSADDQPIEMDSEVVINAIRGVKLIVAKKEEL